jgi:SAM-dependent methyltransferase
MSENYLESISQIELERLLMQHETWKPETDSFLRMAGFPTCKKIVEFGCGPGFTACELAQDISPNAEVYATDISDVYLKNLNDCIRNDEISNLRTIKANLASTVNFGTDFDGAFCRWFLAWVTRDLDAVLANIFNSLKSGGVFASMEYLTLKSTRSSPPNTTFDHVVNAWEDFYLQCGGTTEVGAILPDALVRAGFIVKQIHCVGGLARSGTPKFKWWKRLNEDFNQSFKEKGLLSVEQEAELENFWRLNSQNANSFIYTPILVQIEAFKP